MEETRACIWVWTVHIKNINELRIQASLNSKYYRVPVSVNYLFNSFWVFILVLGANTYIRLSYKNEDSLCILAVVKKYTQFCSKKHLMPVYHHYTANNLSLDQGVYSFHCCKHGGGKHYYYHYHVRSVGTFLQNSSFKY